MRVLFASPIAALALVASTASCLGPSSPALPSRVDPAAVSCSGDLASPFSARQVARVFWANGFSVRAVCHALGEDTVANTGFGESSEVYNRIADAEGDLSCWVSVSDVYGSAPDIDLDESSNSPMYSGRKAGAVLGNVECHLYAGDEPEPQVARFARAVRQLANAPHSHPRCTRAACPPVRKGVGQ